MPNKKLIEFDKYNFEQHQKNYSKYQQALEDVHTELERLMGAKVKTSEYKEGKALQYYYDTLENSKANTMNLTGEAIASLQRESVETLKQLQAKANELKVKPAKLDDYSFYAETEPELKRYEVFQNLVKAWNDFIEMEGTPNLKVYDLGKILTQFRCKMKPTQGTIIPTQAWLKTGKTYLNR